MRQRKGVDEERASAREDEERCGRFLFFSVQGLCGSGGCGHAAAAGGLLPKRVEESESVFGMNFSFFLFNDERSRAYSKLTAVCVGPHPRSGVVGW